MNMKMIGAVLAVAILSLAMVGLQAADADPEGDSGSETGSLTWNPVNVGVGVGNEEASFTALISEAAYTGNYDVEWTVSWEDKSSDRGSSTFTFSVTSGTAGTATPGTSQSTSPAFDVERNGIGNYTITVSEFPTISDTEDDVYTITAVSKITLKISEGEDNELVLNTTTFKGTVTAYNNSLREATAVNLTAKTNYTASNGAEVKFTGFTNPESGTWYATNLPEGLNISNDGKIYGMATSATGEDGKEAKIVIKANGREYFGTVVVNVSDSEAQTYTVSLSEATGNIVGSGTAYSIVGDISDLKLTIDGTPVFNGQVSVIDNTSGQRTTISEKNTQNSAVTYTIGATGGAGSYTIHIVSPSVGYVYDITLTVYPVTSGTTGAGFIIIGSS